VALKFGIEPTEGGHFFREVLAEAARAEELGFDSVWLAEHHGVRDHYWPSPLRVLAIPSLSIISGGPDPARSGDTSH
jgi:alkanesulfonate monooxygenase SsuD/methylene tetrahydromethanopterin reductase-like flavin-dependent oxidoreductase (luciferase family)